MNSDGEQLALDDIETVVDEDDGLTWAEWFATLPPTPDLEQREAA